MINNYESLYRVWFPKFFLEELETCYFLNSKKHLEEVKYFKNFYSIKNFKNSISQKKKKKKQIGANYFQQKVKKQTPLRLFVNVPFHSPKLIEKKYYGSQCLPR